ncbi:hypothetical protein BS78_04G176100 [Paspalum vaginatum]|nr:hypothetical protein BS78_04G176100 [Paspalum vaginatum]
MGCSRSSSTLVMAVVAISLLLTLDRPVAHARHVKSPSSTSTGERPSTEDDEVWQGTSSRKLGAEHTKNTATVHVEKGTEGGNSNSPASSSAEKVVVARYGPRPHPKKHN